MDFSSNLRYILTTYRKVGSIQITVFCYCTIFSYTDSYHTHKSLNILFFKTVNIQFHQVVQPPDEFYPSCIPYLLKGDCNISIFGGKQFFIFCTSLWNVISKFLLLIAAVLMGFHCVSKGPHTFIPHTSYQSGSAIFCEMMGARQTTHLQASCVLSLSWSCSLCCSSPAAGFAPEIPSRFYLLMVQLCCLLSGAQLVPVKVLSTFCCWQDDLLGTKTILEPLSSALHIEYPGRIRDSAKSSLLKQQTFISHFSYCLIF